MEKKLGLDFGRSMTEGDVDKAIEILQKLNKMDVDVKFTIWPKHNENAIEENINEIPQVNESKNEFVNNCSQQMDSIRAVLLESGYITDEMIDYGITRSSTLDGVAEEIMRKFFS